MRFSTLSASASRSFRSSCYDNGATHIVVTLAMRDAVASLAAGPRGDRAVRSHWRELHRRARRALEEPNVLASVGEDPATGSAAGPIACHLARHGLVEWGEWIEISQGVEIGRPSTLFARADGATDRSTRVLCGGRAVVVARGEFRL